MARAGINEGDYDAQRYPKEVVTFLNNNINKVINRPDVKEAWLKGAILLVKTPEEFDANLRKDIEKRANVVKVSEAKV